MFNSQLNKLKSGIKNGWCWNNFILLSKIDGDSNDENNFLHKLLSINTQVSRLHKAFANGSSANIKLSKTWWHKIGQSGGFLSRLLRSITENKLLMKNILKPLAKGVLIPLGLTAAAAAAATDTAIHKKIFGSGTHPSDLAKRTTLIILNEKMNIMKIVKPLEESGLIIEGVSKTIQNEAKEQKEVQFLEW